jgi:RNA polymerase sigma-70 factor, ECF subfamily
MPRLDWSEADETTLVEAAQLGDLAAFDRLARQYRPIGLVLAKRLLDSERAEDAVQDALVAAYKALPQLKSPERFAAWFAAIVRHRAGRAIAAPETLHEPLSDHVDRLIVKWAPSILSHSAEEQGEELEAVRQLPAGLREIVELYYVRECSVGVIADVLSLTQTTVKWRLHQARQFLRRHCLSDLAK